MFIYVKCTGCQGQLRVAESHGGKRVRCPQCRAVSPIPRMDAGQSTITGHTPYDTGSTHTAELTSDDPASELAAALDQLPEEADHPNPLGYRLEIDAAACEASLVAERSPDSLLNGADVERELRKQSVTHGILRDRLQIAIMALNYPDEMEEGRAFTVARGTPPTAGIDGHIDFLVNVSGEQTRIQAEDHDEGRRIDYKSLTAISTVSAQEFLANIHPPTLGTPGIGLDGRPLSPLPSELASVKAGEGVDLSADGGAFIALRDGRPVLHEGVLSVLEVYEVKGDVDMTTGNITFNGHVVIHGNVLDEFEIRAKSLEVHGTVGAAILVCSGDAELKGGVNGNQKGQLRIGGSCTVKYLNEVKAKIGGDLIVERGVTNSNIDCAAAVLAERIVGGRAVALHGFEVNYLGSDLGVVTHVTPGIHYETAHTEALIERLSESLDTPQATTTPPEAPDTQPPDDETESEARIEEGRIQVPSKSEQDELRRRVTEAMEKLAKLTELEETAGVDAVNVGLQCYADVIVQIGALSKEFTSSRSGKMTIRWNPEDNAIEAGSYRRRRTPQPS